MLTLKNFGKRERLSVSENAIERVINQTLTILNDCNYTHDTAVNEQDWKECKQVVVSLWHDLQNLLFILKNPSALSASDLVEKVANIFQELKLTPEEYKKLVAMTIDNEVKATIVQAIGQSSNA